MNSSNSLVYQVLFSILLVMASASLTLGQQYNLTDSDKEEIKRRAKFRMQEFEELLQLISDPTRSRGAIDRYILSSYSRRDSLFNQVFYDEDVKIEDDITPIEFNKENIEASALTVSAYLNNFKLQYNKYLDKTVFFTNMEFSGVQQQNFVYVVVSYDSEFRGRHTIYKSYQYKPLKRKATLRAEYNMDLDRWQVWIAGVNYDRDAFKAESVADTTVAQPADPALGQNDEPTDAVVVEPAPQNDEAADPPALAEREDTTESEPQDNAEAQSLEFVSTFPEAIKKGNSSALRWNEDVDEGEIRLYQGEEQKAVLRKGLYGQQWNWTVQQKPGKDYSIMLYEPATGRQAKSSTFQIRSKFPLALKIAIPVVAVAGAAFLLMPADEPVTTTPGNPTNPPVDYTIDIAPSLPGN